MFAVTNAPMMNTKPRISQTPIGRPQPRGRIFDDGACVWSKSPVLWDGLRPGVLRAERSSSVAPASVTRFARAKGRRIIRFAPAQRSARRLGDGRAVDRSASRV